MQFLVIVKATKRSEAGEMPSTEEFAEMGNFNEGLVRDGWIKAAEGLAATSEGVRLRFSAAAPSVEPGPFTPAEELMAGFWMIEAPSQQAVVERFKSAPFKLGEVLEIRRVQSAEDFDENFTAEVREREEQMRAEVAAQAG